MILSEISSTVDWKKVIIFGAVFDFIFKTYLDLREYRVQSRKEIPEEVSTEKLLDTETFLKSQDYNRTKLRWAMVDRFFDLCINVAFLLLDILPAVYHRAEKLSAQFFTGGELVTGILTMLIFTAISTIISLPFDYYHTFVIEKRFGFNKQTFGLWISDKIKSWVLTLIIMPPILAAVLKIISKFGNKFVLYLVAFMLFLNLATMIVYPTIIAPLFNKYEPLESGELRTAIEDLAKSLNFPLGRIYVVDGSTRSSHSNAYFIGMPWYKQIVLYDTLVSESSVDEIVAILSHELGHWKRNHISILLAVGMAGVALTFSTLGLFLGNHHFFTSLGLREGEAPTIVALLVFTDALGPLEAAIQFLQNFVTRACEYDADRFGARLGYGQSLSRALVALNKSNLGVFAADRLYSTFHHSHPILPERLSAIREYMATSDSQGPESKKRQ